MMNIPGMPPPGHHHSGKRERTAYSGTRPGGRVRPYVLPPVPEKVSKLNARLGHPDVYRVDDSAPEELLHNQHIQQGFKELEPIADVYGRLDVNQFMPQLSLLKRKLIEQEHKLQQQTALRLHRQTSTDKAFGPFPKQVNSTQKDQTLWQQELCSDKPLSVLARTCPHGYKGKSLLDLLCRLEVPLLRASWYVKIVQLNSEHKKQKMSSLLHMLHVSGDTTGEGPLNSLMERKTDWTQILVEYLTNKAKEIQQSTLSATAAATAAAAATGTSVPPLNNGYQNNPSMNASSPFSYILPSASPTNIHGNISVNSIASSNPLTQESRTVARRRFQYVLRLACWQYHEQLLDNHEYIKALADIFKSAVDTDVILWIANALFGYLPAIRRSHILIRHLVKCIASQIQRWITLIPNPPSAPVTISALDDISMDVSMDTDFMNFDKSSTAPVSHAPITVSSSVTLPVMHNAETSHEHARIKVLDQCTRLLGALISTCPDIWLASRLQHRSPFATPTVVEWTKFPRVVLKNFQNSDISLIRFASQLNPSVLDEIDERFETLVRHCGLHQSIQGELGSLSQPFRARIDLSALIAQGDFEKIVDLIFGKQLPNSKGSNSLLSQVRRSSTPVNDLNNISAEAVLAIIQWLLAWAIVQPSSKTAHEPLLVLISCFEILRTKRELQSLLFPLLESWCESIDESAERLGSQYRFRLEWIICELSVCSIIEYEFYKRYLIVRGLWDTPSPRQQWLLSFLKRSVSSRVRSDCALIRSELTKWLGGTPQPDSSYLTQSFNPTTTSSLSPLIRMDPSSPLLPDASISSSLDFTFDDMRIPLTDLDAPMVAYDMMCDTTLEVWQDTVSRLYCNATGTDLPVETVSATSAALHSVSPWLLSSTLPRPLQLHIASLLCQDIVTWAKNDALTDVQLQRAVMWLESIQNYRPLCDLLLTLMNISAESVITSVTGCRAWEYVLLTTLQRLEYCMGCVGKLADLCSALLAKHKSIERFQSAMVVSMNNDILVMDNRVTLFIAELTLRYQRIREVSAWTSSADLDSSVSRHMKTVMKNQTTNSQYNNIWNVLSNSYMCPAVAGFPAVTIPSFPSPFPPSPCAVSVSSSTTSPATPSTPSSMDLHSVLSSNQISSLPDFTKLLDKTSFLSLLRTMGLAGWSHTTVSALRNAQQHMWGSIDIISTLCQYIRDEWLPATAVAGSTVDGLRKAVVSFMGYGVITVSHFLNLVIVPILQHTFIISSSQPPMINQQYISTCRFAMNLVTSLLRYDHYESKSESAFESIPLDSFEEGFFFQVQLASVHFAHVWPLYLHLSRWHQQDWIVSAPESNDQTMSDSHPDNGPANEEIRAWGTQWWTDLNTFIRGKLITISADELEKDFILPLNQPAFAAWIVHWLILDLSDESTSVPVQSTGLSLPELKLPTVRSMSQFHLSCVRTRLVWLAHQAQGADNLSYKVLVTSVFDAIKQSNGRRNHFGVSLRHESDWTIWWDLAFGLGNQFLVAVSLVLVDMLNNDRESELPSDDRLHHMVLSLLAAFTPNINQSGASTSAASTTELLYRRKLCDCLLSKQSRVRASNHYDLIDFHLGLMSVWVPIYLEMIEKDQQELSLLVENLVAWVCHPVAQTNSNWDHILFYLQLSLNVGTANGEATRLPLVFSKFQECWSEHSTRLQPALLERAIHMIPHSIENPTSTSNPFPYPLDGANSSVFDQWYALEDYPSNLVAGAVRDIEGVHKVKKPKLAFQDV
eukprot:GILJ01012386.1.p1 GENE.GILJ01012386.1~~GILJ01012386.1.p1  ORF type:complete len:1736 (-),score=213.62 GILJ01012386.1:178-5385(-)